MRIIKYILLSILTVVALFSCNEEKFITDTGAGIRFSVDTLYFDTVFTELSTITRSFTIHNPHKEHVKISELRLARGNSSVFRINVDGISGTEFSDLELAPSDSMYVFVEATLDPNNSDEILLQKDSVLTITNGLTQDIDIVAWGQDVHMLRQEILKSQTWVNDKPYLVIDYVYVDSLETLTLEPGVRIYLHNNAMFYVGGTLIAEGTQDQPISFTGDRLETMYEDIPGQWGGMWFFAGSKDNILDNTIVRGGTFGLRVDSVVNENPTLRISNSFIADHSSNGIVGRGAEIIAYNNIIANCGTVAVALIIGGSYEFYHCTIANRYNYSPPRKVPSVVLNNYYPYKDKNGKQHYELRDLHKADFYNNIIYGSLENEILIDEFPSDEVKMNYYFNHTLAKLNNPDFNLSDTAHFRKMLLNKDPKFISWNEYDFRLDTLSPAKDAGLLQAGELYPLDMKGDSRIADGEPDLGAFERVE